MTNTETVEKLRAHILTVSGDRLPPVRVLAGQFAVSRVEMRKALAVLEEEGLLKISRGAGCRIVRPMDLVSTGQSATFRLAEKIRKWISGGDIRTGETLPKMETMCRRLNASKSTVAQTYHRLESEGLVHRVGKSCAVGQPIQEPGVTEQRIERVVGVIQLRPTVWKELELEQWGRGFVDSFFAGLLEQHITPIPLVGNDELVNSDLVYRSDIDQTVRALDKKYGRSFLGIAVFGMGCEYVARGTEDFGKLIRALCRYRRPVVWFDYLDEAGHCLKAPEVGRMISEAQVSRDVRKWFRRCAVDEREAIRQAIGALHDAGHRTVGIPDPYHPKNSQWDWTVQRTGFILEEGARLFPDMIFRVCQSQEKGTSDEKRPTVRFLRRCAQRWPDLERRFRARYTPTALDRDRNLQSEMEEFTAIGPLLAPLVFDQNSTALIALNDAAAHRFCRWLRIAHIAVPDRVSVVSFDNRMQNLYPYTVSSVDFGFQNLAWKMVQLLTSNPAIPVGVQGSVKSSIHLNHRISIKRVGQETKGSR